jgi:general secretion pathway protein A
MYKDHFGLEENPFLPVSRTPPPFSSKDLNEAVAHFLYALKNREGFFLLVGEVGTGKSTAIRAMLSALPPEIPRALVMHTSLDAHELLEEVLRRFGLEARETESKPALIARLEQFLAPSAAGEPAVLIVDEAHLLSSAALEELRLLSNLKQDDRPLLQICLVGQPELLTRLREHPMRPLRQRIAVRYVSGAMTRDETAQYIVHRLREAGAPVPHGIFSSGAIQAVHEITQGLPREINVVAGQAMLNAFLESASTVSAQHVRTTKRDYGFEGLRYWELEKQETKPPAPVETPAAAKPAPRADAIPRPIPRVDPVTRPAPKVDVAARLPPTVDPAARPVPKVDPAARPVPKVDLAARPASRVDPGNFVLHYPPIPASRMERTRFMPAVLGIGIVLLLCLAAGYWFFSTAEVGLEWPPPPPVSRETRPTFPIPPPPIEGPRVEPAAPEAATAEEPPPEAVEVTDLATSAEEPRRLPPSPPPPSPTPSTSASASDRLELGASLARSGRFDEAIAAFREALSIQPRYTTAYYNLGLSLLENQEPREAVDALEAAVSLSPEDPLVQRALGIALRQTGDLDEAVGALRRAVALDSGDALSLQYLGRVLRERGELDEAAIAIESAIRLKPDDPLLHQELGFTLRAAGRLEEAVAALQDALYLDSSLAHAHYTLGVTLHEMGRQGDAERELAEAKRLGYAPRE